MKAKDLMSHTIVTCEPDDTMAVAAGRMWDNDCGALPVVAGRHLIGMITDRDICMATFTKDSPPSKLRVHGAMAQSVVSCGPDDDVTHVMGLFRKHQLRRIPVLDTDGDLLGLITLGTLARARREVPQEEVARTLAAVTAPRAPALAAAG